MSDLSAISLSTESLTRLRTSLDTIQQQLSQLKEEGDQALRPELDRVSAAYTTFADSLSAVASSPGTGSLSTLGSSAQELRSAVDQLWSKLQQRC